MAVTDPNAPDHRRAPDAGDRGTGRPFSWLVLMVVLLVLAVAAIFAWG